MNPKEFYEYVLRVTGKSELDCVADFVGWHTDLLSSIVGSWVLTRLLELGKGGCKKAYGCEIGNVAMMAIERNKDEIEAEWKKFQEWCEYQKNKEAKNGKNPS